MKVKMGQFELETDEMATFATDVPSMPYIYVNSSGATFIQTIRTSWLEPKVRHVARAEALRLAGYYKLTTLLERLSERRIR